MAKNQMKKWATHAEWCYECVGLPVDVLRKKLKVTARTISDWDSGRRPIPHWAPKVLRLDRMERAIMLAQMTGQEAVPLRGLVYVDVAAANKAELVRIA